MAKKSEDELRRQWTLRSCESSVAWNMLLYPWSVPEDFKYVKNLWCFVGWDDGFNGFDGDAFDILDGRRMKSMWGGDCMEFKAKLF